MRHSCVICASLALKGRRAVRHRQAVGRLPRMREPADGHTAATTRIGSPPDHWIACRAAKGEGARRRAAAEGVTQPPGTVAVDANLIPAVDVPLAGHWLVAGRAECERVARRPRRVAVAQLPAAASEGTDRVDPIPVPVSAHRTCTGGSEGEV